MPKSRVYPYSQKLNNLAILALHLNTLCERAAQQPSPKLDQEIYRANRQLDRAYNAAVKLGAELGKEYEVQAADGCHYFLCLTDLGVEWREVG